MREEEFRGLIESLVAEHFPDEMPSFRLAGAEEIRRVFGSSSSVSCEGSAKKKSLAKDISEFEFVAEAKAVIEFVALIKGTFEMYQWFSKQLISKDSGGGGERLADRWKAQLVAAGLQHDKAELISLKFSSEVVELFRKP
jgi:hypothetical protein